jgi:O-antigen/teichoic acid export membrane protein
VALMASLVMILIVAAASATGLIRRVYPFANIDYLFLVSFLALPFATDTALLNAVYRANGRVARYALMVPYAQSALRVVAVPLAAAFSPSVAIFLWINTVQIVVSAALLMVDLRRGQSAVARREIAAAPAERVRAEARHVLRESKWMGLSIFVYSLMRSADMMFLGAFAKAASIGEYAALTMVAQLIAIFPMAASQSLGPNISHAYHRGDQPGVKRELDSYLRKSAPISGYIFGGVAIFGQRLDLVFGSSFHFDPVICLILPLGHLMSATLAPMGYALSMTGRHRAENAILSFGGLVLVVLCALFIPRYGTLAAASAVTFTFFLVNVLRFALVTQVIGSVPGRHLDLAPAPAALALAWLAAYFCDSLGPRNLAVNFAGCLLYTLMFGVVAMALFLDAEIRAKIARALGISVAGSNES